MMKEVKVYRPDSSLISARYGAPTSAIPAARNLSRVKRLQAISEWLGYEKDRTYPDGQARSNRFLTPALLLFFFHGSGEVPQLRRRRLP